MPIIRFDGAEQKFYEIIGDKKVYLTEKQLKQKLLRKAKWEKLTYGIIKTLKGNRIVERIGYTLETYTFDLDYGSSLYRCGRCGRNKYLYLQPRATHMYVSCAFCSLTQLLSEKEYNPRANDFDFEPASYISDFQQKELTLQEACKWWVKTHGSTLYPPTDEMAHAIGYWG